MENRAWFIVALLFMLLFAVGFGLKGCRDKILDALNFSTCEEGCLGTPVTLEFLTPRDNQNVSPEPSFFFRAKVTEPSQNRTFAIVSMNVTVRSPNDSIAARSFSAEFQPSCSMSAPVTECSWSGSFRLEPSQEYLVKGELCTRGNQGQNLCQAQEHLIRTLSCGTRSCAQTVPVDVAVKWQAFLAALEAAPPSIHSDPEAVIGDNPIYQEILCSGPTSMPELIRLRLDSRTQRAYLLDHAMNAIACQPNIFKGYTEPSSSGRTRPTLEDGWRHWWQQNRCRAEWYVNGALPSDCGGES